MDGASPPTIGWGRAALEALGILTSGIVLLVLVPNWALTKLTGLSRDARVAIATTGFVVLLVACAWTLRRLQARHVI